MSLVFKKLKFYLFWRVVQILFVLFGGHNEILEVNFIGWANKKLGITIKDAVVNRVGESGLWPSNSNFDTDSYNFLESTPTPTPTRLVHKLAPNPTLTPTPQPDFIRHYKFTRISLFFSRFFTKCWSWTFASDTIWSFSSLIGPTPTP